MKQKKLLVLGVSVSLVLVLASLSLIGGCPTPAEPPPEAPPPEAPPPGPPEVKTLQVGNLVSLTGWFAIYDVLDYEGCKIATDMINERGGITINGQQYLIELLSEDCKSTLDGTTAATNTLVYDKKVKFIVGPNAFFSSATTPVCEPNKVLHVMGHCMYVPGELDEATPYAFLAGDGIGLTYALASYIKEKHPEIKSYVATAPDDGSIPYVSVLNAQAMASRGITDVGDWVGYSTTTVDFSPIASKLHSREADAIFMINGLEEWGGQMLKGLRELGDQRFVFMIIAGNPTGIKIVAGRDKAVNFAMGAVVKVAVPDNPPQLDELMIRYIEKFGTDRVVGYETANAIWALADAIQTAQSLDPTVVRDSWEQMDTCELIVGTGVMGGEDIHGIKHYVIPRAPVVVVDENGMEATDGWYSGVP